MLAEFETRAGGIELGSGTARVVPLIFSVKNDGVKVDWLIFFFFFL